MRNGIDRYSSGAIDGRHYQIDARNDGAPGKWGGFAASTTDGEDCLRIDHKYDSIDGAIHALNIELYESGLAVTLSGSTNMTVAQLISALLHLPPDAPIITHANNHSTGLGTNNDQRVALTKCGGRDVVIIGNWSEYNVNSWRPEAIPTDVWSVKTWGKRAGILTRGSIKLHPETEAVRPYVERKPATYKFTDEAE